MIEPTKPQQQRARDPFADLALELADRKADPFKDLATELGHPRGGPTVEDKLKALPGLSDSERQQHINRLHENRVEQAKLGNELDELNDPSLLERSADRLYEMGREIKKRPIMAPLGMLGSMAAAPVESGANVVAPTVEGAERANADPGFNARNVARFGRELHAKGVTGEERAAATAQTLANVVLPGLGVVKGGVLAGAAYSPDDPIAGGIEGGLLGTMFKQTGRAYAGSKAAAAERAATEYKPAVDKAFGDLAGEMKGTAPKGDVPEGYAREVFAEGLERGLPDAARASKEVIPKVAGLEDAAAGLAGSGAKRGRVTGQVEGLEVTEPAGVPRRTKPLKDVERAGDVVADDAAVRQKAIDDAITEMELRDAELTRQRVLRSLTGVKRRPGGIKPEEAPLLARMFGDEIERGDAGPGVLPEIGRRPERRPASAPDIGRGTEPTPIVPEVGRAPERRSPLDQLRDEIPPTKPPPDPITSPPGDIPDVPSNTFGHPTEGMGTVRRRVKSFAKAHLLGGKFRNEATGWDVSVASDAIDHTMHPEFTQNWYEAALALRALPDLIRDGAHFTTEATIGGGAKAHAVPLHHRLRAPFTVDGQPFVAELTLRELRDVGPRKLYHVKAIKVEPDVPPAVPDPRNPAPWGQPPGETPGSILKDTPAGPELSSQTGGALPSYPEGFAMGGPEGRIPDVPRRRGSSGGGSDTAAVEEGAPAGIDRPALEAELESLKQQRAILTPDTRGNSMLSEDALALAAERRAPVDARIAEVEALLENTVTRSAKRSSIDLSDAPRYEDGSRRPLHTVTVKGLIDEILDLEEKRVDAGGRSQYEWASDENMHYMDDNRRFPVATRVGGKGVSQQAKALQNLEDFTRIEGEVLRELEKARGLPKDVIDDLLNRERDARIERQAMSETSGAGADLSFDPDELMAGKHQISPDDISPNEIAADDSFDFGANLEPDPVTAAIDAAHQIPLDEPTRPAAAGAELPDLPSGVPRKGELLNRSVFDEAPEIQGQVDAAEASLARRGVTKERVPIAEGRDRVRAMTRETLTAMGIDPLTMDLKKVGRLSGEEIVAFKQAATESMDHVAALSKELEQPGLSLEERGSMMDLLERTIEERDAILERVVHASSQKGRDLNFLRQIANRSLDPDVWVVQARRISGDRPLSDATIATIRKLARETAEACGL